MDASGGNIRAEKQRFGTAMPAGVRGHGIWGQLPGNIAVLRRFQPCKGPRTALSARHFTGGAWALRGEIPLWSAGWNASSEDGPAEVQTGKGYDMALPEFTMRQLLEAGVHYGHQTARWNPKMGEYIYGDRNGIHILDLTQTVPMLDQALKVVRDTVAKGGRILFVGTKRQAQKAVAEAAEKSAQFYMNHRWLGGTLTNWKTVSQSINRLKQIDEQMANGAEGLTKKERLHIEREQTKLQASLGGIREMGGIPDLIFIIDVGKEDLAILEAKKLGIPVVAVVDTNCSPKGVDYVIPGNDDAARAIALYCDLVSRAALDGMTAQMGAAGIDLGALEDVIEEEALAEPATESVAEASAEPVTEA
tara:strand:+ start:843 stop:1928 length:1086 start_codon:yes stop_codon:yes gene_type:complete